MENTLLGRSRSGVGVGVGVDIFRPESELESESLKIRRLRSPGHRYEAICNEFEKFINIESILCRLSYAVYLMPFTACAW